MSNNDNINHPKHYNNIPGIECIDVAKHFGFVIGNVIKYLWRADEKPIPGKTQKQSKLEHYKKARWLLDYAIDELEQECAKESNRASIAVQSGSSQNDSEFNKLADAIHRDEVGVIYYDASYKIGEN